MSGSNIAQYGKLSLTYSGQPGQPYRLQLAGKNNVVRDQVHHAQPYGFVSHALPGAEHVTLQLGGDAASSICIVVADRRYVMEVAAGEVALHDDQGQHVHLTRDGIVITSTKGVTVDTPLVTFTGDIEVSGIRFLPHQHGGIVRGGADTDPPKA